MTPAEIRSLYVDTLAEAAYLRWVKFRAEESVWSACKGEWRDRFIAEATDDVDALAAAGRLPVAEERRYIGQGERRRTRLVTGWMDPE